jgi:hypothetical protein
MSTISASTTSTTAYKVTADTTGALVLQTGATPTTAVTVAADQSVTFAQAANLPNTFGFKNRIINGGMVIDQRNAGASVTPISGQLITDRWKYGSSQTSKFTSQQSTTAPTGFINSLLFTSSSAYAVLAADIFGVSTAIEGLNVSDLAWGTASAATITISFWVRSSLTGTFAGVVKNSASSRSYPFTYTISSANTFEQKSVTIAGDTTGTWLTTNGIGLTVIFSLGTGSTYSGTAGAWVGSDIWGVTGATNVVGTNGATFYITGVQLEKGSTATSFDYRPYGTELQLCQRYFETGSLWREGTNATSGNFCVFSETFKVQKRSNATFVYGNVVAANANISSISGPEAIYDSISPFNQTNIVTGFAFRFIPSNATSTIRQYWLASAEL